ncbi:MAG TPA: glycoside hydrolase family 16 protein, partial [Candidatus Polarisedimenticolia bacterium]|nr:glycoside hydrolase family 16 protein [Candidatus Polarisedimenticolia bacterium]
MLRYVKDRCRVSTVVLALALTATAFLPDLLAGRQDVAASPAPESGGIAVSPESSPASFTDTTSADFSAGTPDAGTYISETADGEIILAPTFGTEFSGDSLPAGMFSTQWFPPSGVATFAGGKVTLDGVLLGTDASYGPGRTLEFSGNIGGASLDSLGLGTNLTTAPWGVFRTGLFVFNLMTSTNDGTAQGGNVPGMVFDAFHRYRIDWAPGSISYFVDGTLVVTNSNSPTADMRPLFSNLFFGGKNNILDWVRLTPYALAGTFESRVFDAGGSAHWLDLVATASMPDGASIIFETRSGDTSSPDATWSDWQSLAGGSIASPNAQFIQYRALLTTSDPAITPEVQSVLINYETGCADEICNGIDDDCDGEIDEGGAALCDDHDPCTADACVDGACVNTPAEAGTTCDDGDACTTEDTCDADGKCAGKPIICDDEYACTRDACVDGECISTPLPAGTTCDDFDACTTEDTCDDEGICTGKPIICDDENACTRDACDKGACVYTPTPNATCDDGDACTTEDTCNADGKCAGKPVTCNDGNACTRDA